jgi:hypothetical protein
VTLPSASYENVVVTTFFLTRCSSFTATNLMPAIVSAIRLGLMRPGDIKPSGACALAPPHWMLGNAAGREANIDAAAHQIQIAPIRFHNQVSAVHQRAARMKSAFVSCRHCTAHAVVGSGPQPASRTAKVARPLRERQQRCNSIRELPPGHAEVSGESTGSKRAIGRRTF